VWVDDPSFNLDYHVRHTALPSPGTWEQLQDLTARIFSQQLDRSKPLWEMWLVEGYEADRFALITKTHHSLIDGIAGVDLATVLFDLSPDPPPLATSGRPWTPHSEPGIASLVAAGLLGIGTAMVYPTLIAAVSDATQPRDRARVVGVYRFWRDLGFVLGALIAGIGADATSPRTAILIVALLTGASGILVAATSWQPRPVLRAAAAP